MKQKLIIAVITALFSTAILAEDTAISNIRKLYEEIQKQSNSFKKEKLDLGSDYSTEGGELTAYRDNTGKIKVLRVELYFETGKVFENFYYNDNNELIFAFYKDYKYNSPFYVTKDNAKEMGLDAFDEKKSVLKEQRYYFDKLRLIRYVEDKKTLDVKTDEFKNAETEVMNTSREMRAKFK